MSALKSFFSQGRNTPFAIHAAPPGVAVLFLLCAFFTCGTAVGFAQTNIAEYQIGRQAAVEPAVITYGPDGAYWFTELALNNGALGRIDAVSNVITEIGLTNNPYAAPFGITTGPDGNLWFTEHVGTQVGRMSTNGSYVEFPLTNANATPGIIVKGPDNKMWFVEYNLNKIATFDPFHPTNSLGQLNYQEFGPFGTSTRFGAPGTKAEIYGMTGGPDGNIWFTQVSYGAIGKLSPNGDYSLTYLAASNCQPESIVTGPDNAMWFTEFNTNKIGRMTTDGVLAQEFTIPTYPGVTTLELNGITAGQDGNLWFTEYTGSAIGRLTPTGIVTLFLTPTFPGAPLYLATGTPGGDPNIYFTEFPSQGNPSIFDAIGRLLVGESLNLTAGNLTGSETAFNGRVGTFQNSTAVNTVTVLWGDGTTSVLAFNNPNVNSSATVTNLVVRNSMTITNTLTVTNVMGIGTNGSNGTFDILASHTYPAFTNYSISVNITDARNDMAVASNLVTVVTSATMSFHTSGTNMVLSWPSSNFVLQSAPAIGGAWSNISGATSPYTNPITGSSKYFRLKSN